MFCKLLPALSTLLQKLSEKCFCGDRRLNRNVLTRDYLRSRKLVFEGISYPSLHHSMRLNLSYLLHSLCATFSFCSMGRRVLYVACTGSDILRFKRPIGGGVYLTGHENPDAKSSLIGRLMIRKLLHTTHNIPYSEIKLLRTKKGKPYQVRIRIHCKVLLFTSPRQTKSTSFPTSISMYPTLAIM